MRPVGGTFPSLLTTGLSVGTGLDEEDVERRREVPGSLVLLVSLVKGHEQVLLDRQGGLGKHGRAFSAGKGTAHPPHPQREGDQAGTAGLNMESPREGLAAASAGKVLDLEITQFLLLFFPPRAITGAGTAWGSPGKGPFSSSCSCSSAGIAA